MEKDILIEEICSMQKCLTSKLKSYLDSGLEQADTKEVGEIADVIKDFADAKKNLLEACYYETVVDAMKEGGERPSNSYNPYMGYNNTSGSNSGRNNSNMGYDNTGRDYNGRVNSYMGYKPYLDQEPYIRNYISEHGREYDDWKDAKRHYTDTHSIQDKEKMNEHTKKHVEDVITTLREMWTEADPSLRSSMKSELTSLVSSM